MSSMEVDEVDDEVSFRVKDHSASPVRVPLSDVSNLASLGESPMPEGRHPPQERCAVIERNKDVIQLYKRTSLARASDQGCAETPPPEPRLQLERDLSRIKHDLYRAEERCAELGQRAAHWQRLCEADGVFDEQTSRARYLERLNRRQNKMEALVDRLCTYVDAESMVQESDDQARAKARAVRKSLELMSTMDEGRGQEGEEEGQEGGGGGLGEHEDDSEAWREVGLVVRLKREAAEKEELLGILRDDLHEAKEGERAARQRAAQLTTENEELNELTVEMQAAHARLLAMVQAVERQKKEQQQQAAQQDCAPSPGAAEAAALGGQVEELRRERDALLRARDDAETRAERLHSDLAARVGEVARLREEADAWVQENSRLEVELERREEEGAEEARALRQEGARLGEEAADLRRLLRDAQSESAVLAAAGRRQEEAARVRWRAGGGLAALAAVILALILHFLAPDAAEQGRAPLVV